MTTAESLEVVANALADAARDVARRYFRATDIGTENKTVGSGSYDPVTLADRGIERRMRDILSRARPDDGIEGEEFGKTEGSSGYTWVLDPIDGTRAFVCGLPSWGVLIAVNDGTRPVFGLMDQPITGERFSGSAGLATLVTRDGTRKMQTSRVASLGDAVLCSTSPDLFSDSERPLFEEASRSARITRYGTDCYGYSMLAAGHVDLVIESGLNPYDIQALIPIVEGAGGIVTSWTGGDAQDGGQVVAAASASLHREALAILSAGS